ncbi:hypothetical protein CAT723_01080 [Corynebacterium ammoniagenes]|uniref:Uncharacterized protein n=1 Tax=Corynebacterium ammoniagenes TaxID=1697 RepID=A0AAV5G4T8_CORAM|nr:hypothetical protein CAT723_01080 [Corynebacterium ammoniagenes]
MLPDHGAVGTSPVGPTTFRRLPQEGRGHAESIGTILLIELAVTLLGSEMILVED